MKKIIKKIWRKSNLLTNLWHTMLIYFCSKPHKIHQISVSEFLSFPFVYCPFFFRIYFGTTDDYQFMVTQSIMLIATEHNKGRTNARIGHLQSEYRWWYLSENVADPFGNHKNNHQRQSEADAASGFDQDDSQADGHAYDSTYTNTVSSMTRYTLIYHMTTVLHSSRESYNHNLQKVSASISGVGDTDSNHGVSDGW